jgi:hypothetical protein
MYNWNPYTIPPTPDVAENELYALSVGKPAVAAKNPSQFLRWERSIPRGTKLGDLLYWNPSLAPDGGWSVLTSPNASGSIMHWNGGMWEFLAPPGGNDLFALTIQGGNLNWTATEDC